MKSQAIFFLLMNSVLFSCNEKSKTDNDTRLLKENDNNKCQISSLVIPEIKSTSSEVYNKPIAITFFTLNKLLAKYDGVNQDSLPPILRKPGRQEIYRTYDVVGIYEAIIHPKLDSLSIKIMDVDTDGVLSFNVVNTIYSIDKSIYKEMDGVLFYNGKDKPIFWTEGVYCSPEHIVQYYYKNNNQK